LFGPFGQLEAIVPSLRKKLQQTSPAGLKMFDEVIAIGGLSSFEHIVAPLPDGHSMTIRLIKEQNAAVSATLPGPAWYVVFAELLSPPSKWKNLFLCGTYTSTETANQAAQRAVVVRKQRVPGAVHSEEKREDGTIQCTIVAPNKIWVIESRFDSGVQYFED
jgi:hypothetical protein